MMSGNSDPMFVEETFRINIYGSDSEVSEFNSLMRDATGNYVKIKEFVERVFKFS